ncbi:dnaJ homolog subfamily C member 21 isoform X1 [Diorhabda sublineata]|uniref:dnaJ homolog subfamily C member 21 isoform X1 n=1 Tax=Diorhabda sublineata TaxID=1163346 RepID=UPI0024E05CD5|nr:dnaJ homolog subfamily C member 21 isoform X1 [Diorhabda sublineata]
MKCYYEVLNITQNADESEIKSAYRKLALKWHPDKNLENPDQAKNQFQIVQQAYDVLSDRQERAWYDNHREQILRGSNSDFEDKSLNVFQYFTTSCFQGYEDDENGFYTVYRNVFQKIAEEDIEFMEDKDEFIEIPGFGDSKSDFKHVSEFYAFWISYSTKKSFVWLDPYDVKNIRDRKYLKLIEKENKKVRMKARKERNEEVRNLVAFVKKRDKRIQAQKKIQEQKILEDKKRRETLSKQKKIERQQELDKARLSCQAQWSKFENVESELEQIESQLVEQFGDLCSDDDEDLDNLYCIACSKLFKTPKAFENHESSKKHKENMEFLKSSMLEEEISQNISENRQISSAESDTECEEIEDTNKNKKKKKKSKVIVIDEDDELSNYNTTFQTTEDTGFDDSVKKQKKKNKKDTKTKVSKDTFDNGDIEEVNSPASENLNMNGTKKKVKTKKVALKQNININNCCVTCKLQFPSKNKLFNHLKSTGHGIYIPPNIVHL